VQAAVEQREQGGLAGAVATDQADRSPGLMVTDALSSSTWRRGAG
jgi:hypothetical protein